MSYSGKKVALTLACSALMTATTIVQSKAASDPFYDALNKTQSQQFTEASQDLDSLSAKFQRKGDRINSYRAKATADVIRYHQGRIAEYNENSSSRSRPKWYILSSCWGPGVDAINGVGGCPFVIDWLQPPTKFSNMGGIIVLTNPNPLGQVPSTLSPNSSAPIYGFLDAVVVPTLKTNETVTSFCKITKGKNQGQGAIAIATFSKKQNKFINLRRAWYTDFQSKRIKLIDSSLISCTVIESGD